MRQTGGSPLNLDAALVQARQQLGGKDAYIVAANSRADYESGYFVLPYFGDRYSVGFPRGDVWLGDVTVGAGQRDVPKVTQVLLLHYLVNASGSNLIGRWVSYRELPQGDAYERAFHQRAVAPIEVAFGHDLDGFLEAGRRAGGERARLADASFFFRVLPRVPMMCTLWIGDDEVPPGANVLFDAAAGAYLPGEDLAYLGIALAGRLLGAKNGTLLT